MKKVIFAFVFCVSLVSAMNAQVTNKAIGLRFGGVSGYGAEISYQHPLGQANRLEADLGINPWGLGLTAVYQWVWDLSELAPGFNWYAGAGGMLGLQTYNSFGIGVVGQVGLEYNFTIPLQLSLDYRPGIYLLPTVGGSYDGISLSARYKF